MKIITCTITIKAGDNSISASGCIDSRVSTNSIIIETLFKTDTWPTYGCWVGFLGTTRCGCRYASEPVKAAGRIHRPHQVMYEDISRVGQELPWQEAMRHRRPHGYSKAPMPRVTTPDYFTGALSAWGMGDADLVHYGVAPFCSSYKGNFAF